MASLKSDRARASIMPSKTKPRLASITKARRGWAVRGGADGTKKLVLGLGLSFAIAAFLVDTKAFSALGIGDLAQYLAGLVLVTAIPVYILYRDLVRYKKDVVADYEKLILICAVLLGSVAVMRFSAELFSTFTSNVGALSARTGYFAIPVAVGSMLATLLIDIHVGIVVSFVMSIFAGVLIGAEPLFFVYVFAGSITAAFSVIRCTQRSALLKAGLYVTVANLATAAFLDLYRHSLVSTAGFYDLVAAAVGGMLTGVIVSGFLPLFESAFKVVTDISLIEYSDLNRPVLKNLMVSAPGTYHHSVIIGSLSEAASEAVGVNPQLARVAAYYHDIGKIKKPEYFIENQAKGENRHDRLTPSMSGLIISSHVKDGVELAREHKLPPQIIDIIRQHHGTCLMTYFYEKAKTASQDAESVREEEYRYPGPKPQTKVAAIVMLADAVEAASRVLENPTPPRISAMTNKIITRIFEDGQLNECELTLKDLTEITKSFNLLLSGIYHHRIDYPGLRIPAGGEKRKVAGQDTKFAEEGKGPGWEARGGRPRGPVITGIRRR